MNLAEQTQYCQDVSKKYSDPSVISSQDIATIYQVFIDCISDHNHRYYVENKPMISDVEYDRLFSYLQSIEEYFPHLITSNSPTQSLVGQISEEFVHADHKVKLLSLENSYNTQDLIDFDEFITKHLGKQEVTTYSYTIEPKFDGISVELIYKNGDLHQAITRGDGQTGDDITLNVQTIKNIPKHLPFLKKDSPTRLHCRAEILMPKSVRKNLNQQREKEGLAIFANTRNAAAGSIKLLDSGEVAKRGLVCFVYDVLLQEPVSLIDVSTHEELLDILKKEKMPIFDRRTHASTMQEVIDVCMNPETKKFFEQQDYDFDGLVIKVNEFSSRTLLGDTQHHPRWAIAYKFPAQQVSTRVNSVDFQVGRTGVITPVANLEPVQLSGVTISRVSLHNIDFIKHKDIHVGDWVWVQRSGEVIPYIVGVIADKRDPNITLQQLESPVVCPVCGTQTISVDMHTYCPNSSCSAQVEEKIAHFVSKQCMQIEGIGESIIHLLVERKLLENIYDLYSFQDVSKRMILHSLPGFGDKKIAEVEKQLISSKKKPLWRLLHGIGIVHIGKKAAQRIQEALQKVYLEKNSDAAKAIYSYADIIDFLSNDEAMKNVYGIGEKMMISVRTYVQANRHVLERLDQCGLNFSPFLYDTGYIQTVDSIVSGKKFAVTGTLPISRDTIVQMFTEQGAIFDAQITKQTDFLLLGEDGGTKKEKAVDAGIVIYEGRDTIKKNFPFLDTIQTQAPKKDTKPTMSSLFG